MTQNETKTIETSQNDQIEPTTRYDQKEIEALYAELIKWDF